MTRPPSRGTSDLIEGLRPPLPLLAHCRRNVVLQQVGSYLGYTGRGADAFGKAARDPNGIDAEQQRAIRARARLIDDAMAAGAGRC
jgi:hypothetical protein